MQQEVVSPAEYNSWRTARLAQRQKDTGIKTYPHKFETTCSVAEFHSAYNSLRNDEKNESVTVSLAGRIMRINEAGAKLLFYDLIGEGEKIQVYVNVNKLEEDNVEIVKVISRGDIIGVTGYPTRTKRGELSIVPKRMILLTPCTLMLPGVRDGLSDQETRYRQRYLDLIV